MSRLISAIVTIIILTILFLTYLGIETDKFDVLIKNKANEVNKYVKLDFKRTKIYLNPLELNLAVRLKNPKILVKKNEIDLSKLDLYLPLRSFVTSDFMLEKAQIAFVKNDIKDLTKVTNIFLPKIINNQLNKIFHEGNLEGEFNIPFKKDGSVDDNYGFNGKVSNASLNLNREFSIQNLTMEIRNIKSNEKKGFEIKINNGLVDGINLANSIINMTKEKEGLKVKSLMTTKGQINFSLIKKVQNIFSLNLNYLKDIKATVDFKTNIIFDIDKIFRTKNLTYNIEGDLVYLNFKTKKSSIIKNFLPYYDPEFIFKDSKIKISNSKSKVYSELFGLIKTNNKFSEFKIKNSYNYKDKSFDINCFLDLTNSKIRISKLNYKKDYNENSEVNFNIKFSPSKYYNINNLNFLHKNTFINLSNIKLNKNFEINDLESVEIKTFKEKVKNNDFFIKNKKKLLISGDVFDAQPLLKSLYKKSDKNTFSKKFNREIEVNFNQVLTGTNDELFDLAMIASINNGSYNKLSLKGNFSKYEIVEMSIYQIDKDKKTLQVISDRARPFIKNFEFIEGFEGGKLEYESTISKNVSNSNLLITDFKVSKVPALAKLLTLASLQGIADTLGGEGIRFDSFEMKSNSKDNLMNIDDALAIGPAVSILLSGYVDKGKTVSLRGTLVPATKLNAIIASIPLVGDILVGKKTGEGVVGVSFKMKGPPKDIKTTVNPIKTLTPRFIVRAVEKMKKKEEAN